MRALCLVFVVACSGGSSSADAGSDGGARACTIALSGDVNVTVPCEVAVGSVGFSIDVTATATQPFHVSIPCDTPSEVKVGTFTPPSCQASIDEAGGQKRSWANGSDLKVEITSVASPMVGVMVISGTGSSTMAPSNAAAMGSVTMKVTF